MSIKLGSVFGNVSDQTRNAALHVGQTAIYGTGLISGTVLGMELSKAQDFNMAATFVTALAGTCLLGATGGAVSKLLPAEGKSNTSQRLAGMVVAAAMSFGIGTGVRAVAVSQFPDSAYAQKIQHNKKAETPAPAPRVPTNIPR